jgi:MFS family permease
MKSLRALAVSGSFPISLILMAIVGAGGITMAATANATIQLSVPDGLRGRVMSVYTTVFSASVPVGGLLMGALASTAGIPIAIGIGGVLSLVSGVTAFVWWQRIRTSWTGVPPDQVPSIYIGAGAPVDVTGSADSGADQDAGIAAPRPATSSPRP